MLKTWHHLHTTWRLLWRPHIYWPWLHIEEKSRLKGLYLHTGLPLVVLAAFFILLDHILISDTAYGIAAALQYIVIRLLEVFLCSTGFYFIQKWLGGRERPDDMLYRAFFVFIPLLFAALITAAMNIYAPLLSLIVTWAGIAFALYMLAGLTYYTDRIPEEKRTGVFLSCAALLLLVELLMP